MLVNKIGILGYGEIGSSLEKCYLGKYSDIKLKDLHFAEDIQNCDVLNICIPYSDNFVDIIVKEIEQNNPKRVIIHSTVIPGTTKQIQSRTKIPIVYSPVRGVHPNLYQGLKTFVKYYAGSWDAVEHFKSIGIQSEKYSCVESLELAKLLCTTYYGLAICWHGEVNQLCEQMGLDFNEVSTKWNETYNDGYSMLGMKNVVRPVLYPPKDNKIGGHCVIPNTELLQTVFKTKLLDSILRYK